MRLALTGGAGFIGSCYLKKLNDLGLTDVLVVDKVQDPTQFGTLSGKKYADYMSAHHFLQLIEETPKMDHLDALIHLGACADTTETDKAYLNKNNLFYSQSLAKWALARDKIFHYASSASVYGNGEKGYDDDPKKMSEYKPLNLYAESKYDFDHWVIDNGILDRVVGFRYFNVYGPNEYHKDDMKSMVAKSYDQITQTGKANLFASSRPGFENGSEERDFIYVKDVNDVMSYFLENPNRRGIFNVGTGKARTFKDLVSAVFAALGKKPVFNWIPMPDKLKGQYQYYTQAEIKRLRNAGYQKEFTSLEDAVKDYVQAHLEKNKAIL